METTLKVKSPYHISSKSWKNLTLSLILFLSALTPIFAQGETSSSSFWLWDFLGRLHPMVVHFPIALLLFATFLELHTLKNYSQPMRKAINLMVYFGATSVFSSVIFGLLLAENEGTSGSTLDLHKYIGIAAAILSIALIYFVRKAQTHPSAIKIYRSLLVITAVGVGFAGHFGASLTHGESFLTETLPFQNDEDSPESITINLASFQNELSSEQEVQLVTNVRSVFAHNCYKCHSGAKIEGDLRLDEKEFIFAGGESGPIFEAGNPNNSDLIRRISLPKNHKDVMPSKGKLLTKEEIQLLTIWVEKGAPWPEKADNFSVYRVAELAPRKPNLPPVKSGLENPIDRLVNQYFEKNSIEWTELVDDRTFLRRAYLDIVGLIPSPSDLEEFETDPDPNKRSLWVERLLNQTDDYSQHWLTFWNDALRNDYTGTGYITGGRFAITDWIYTSLRENKPYDLFVKELLSPTDKSKGFIEGIRWRGTVNASQRTEMQAAQNVGQVILGLNLKCASCHDSFISDWKLEESYAFANIFADSTLEISRCEKPTGKMAQTKILWEDLGEIDSLATKAEKLQQLADQLVQPKNGRLSRTIVNRIWKQMMGRGIVEPVDEMDNEPWSQDLLDWLASDFTENGYDLKRLIKQIASSRIYQSQSIPVPSSDFLLGEDYQFEGMVRRRMTAEQFSDAISLLAAPLFDSIEVKFKPYELIPEAIQNREFARASLVANNEFLKALGRPTREIVSTSRDSQASLLQALELSNGDKLNSALQKGAVTWIETYPDSQKLTRELFANAVLREPNSKEMELAMKTFGEKPAAPEVQDFLWALFLSPEFQMIY